MLGASLAGSLAIGSALHAEEVTATIDFEGIPAGTLISTVDGTSDAGAAGPILLNGLNPLVPLRNAALIFDSEAPTGGDIDLGTPNEDFGGPGVGEGGEAGQPTQNDTAQGNILVITENFNDADGDGLIDDPDDEDQIGMVLYFDFSTITAPFVPDNVRVNAVTILDVELEQGEAPASVVLFGADDLVLAEVEISEAGDNGKVIVDLGGVDGVLRMEVRLNGSGAVDDVEVVLEREDEEDCGPCEGGVTELTLSYDGDEAAHVVVVAGWCDVIYCDTVEPGQEFTLTRPWRCYLGRKVRVYVDGCYHTKFTTNCWRPIGPGLSKGDFTVVSGRSKHGGELCEYVPAEPSHCYPRFRRWSWRW